jgi:hypothetical protein
MKGPLLCFHDCDPWLWLEDRSQATLFRGTPASGGRCRRLPIQWRSLRCPSPVVFPEQSLRLHFLSATPVQADDQTELFEFVCRAHQASLDSIRTCSCKVDFSLSSSNGSSSAPVTQSCSSTCWYSQEATRLKSTIGARTADGQSDMVWQGTTRTSLVHQPTGGVTQVGAGRDHRESRHDDRCDPWNRGLLVLYVPDTVECLPFQQFAKALHFPLKS